MEITVYSQESCPPCVALKKRLDKEKIPYANVFTKDMSEREREWLRENILRVSKIGRPTVPAARIVNGKRELWVSNHGETDVTEMIDSIKKIIGRA